MFSSFKITSALGTDILPLARNTTHDKYYYRGCLSTDWKVVLIICGRTLRTLSMLQSPFAADCNILKVRNAHCSDRSSLTGPGSLPGHTCVHGGPPTR